MSLFLMEGPQYFLFWLSIWFYLHENATVIFAKREGMNDKLFFAAVQFLAYQWFYFKYEKRADLRCIRHFKSILDHQTMITSLHKFRMIILTAWTWVLWKSSHNNSKKDETTKHVSLAVSPPILRNKTMERDKARDMTQSYDKRPYPNRKFKINEQHKNTTESFHTDCRPA